ncbi:MAG: trimethylamine methyltransferase family protein, partial [Pseudomonadota bacterium]
MTRRGRARADRIAARTAAAPQINPSPPGQIGGRYRPLTEGELRAIYDTSLRILEELGMAEVPQVAEAQALKKGAFKNDLGRLCFSRAMVEDIVAGAPKKFVFHGRDPARDFELGGDRVYFGTGGAAVQTLDLDNGIYRPATLLDLYDFARLIDTLPNVSWFTRCCVATDVEDIVDLDVNTAYALLAGTTKP